MCLAGARFAHEQQARLLRVREVARITAHGEIDLGQFAVSDGIIARQQEVLKRCVGVERRQRGSRLQPFRAPHGDAVATDGAGDFFALNDLIAGSVALGADFYCGHGSYTLSPLGGLRTGPVQKCFQRSPGATRAKSVSVVTNDQLARANAQSSANAIWHAACARPSLRGGHTLKRSDPASSAVENRLEMLMVARTI